MLLKVSQVCAFLSIILSLIFLCVPFFVLCFPLYLPCLFLWNVLSLHNWRTSCPIKLLLPHFHDRVRLSRSLSLLSQSFINKCDCTKQVNLINVEVTITLSGSFSNLANEKVVKSCPMV